MSKYLPFLKSVWNVFSIDPQNIPSYWMENWVDEKVYHKLGEFTSVGQLATLCETESATSESFEKTIKNLNLYWSKLSARAKDALIQIIKIHKFEDLVNFDLQLTYEEQEELKIRWEISDILYFEKKQEAIKACKEFGLDLENGDIQLSDSPEMISNCTGIILSALKYKLESDLAVVGIAAPNNLRRYIEIIGGRLRSEYSEFLKDFRVALVNLEKFFLKWSDSTEAIIDLTANNRTERILSEFKEGFKKLLLEIPKSQPNSAIYNRVQEMVRTSVNTSTN